jgi:hypothetical protein
MSRTANYKKGLVVHGTAVLYCLTYTKPDDNDNDDGNDATITKTMMIMHFHNNNKLQAETR